MKQEGTDSRECAALAADKTAAILGGVEPRVE